MKANRKLRRAIVSVILAVFIKAAVIVLMSLIIKNGVIASLLLSELFLFMASVFICFYEEDSVYKEKEEVRYFDKYTFCIILSLGFDVMLILFGIIALIIEAIKEYIDD